MFDKKVLHVYSIVVGVFFIASGIGKVIDTAGFSELILQYGLGYMMILSPLIVILEIVLGVRLLLLIKTKRTACYSFLLLFIFTLAFAYAHFAKGVDDCGCFGSLQPANISPVFSFARNFILLMMLLVLWIKYPTATSETVKWKKQVLLSCMCVVIFIAGFTFKTPAFLKSKEEKNHFLEQYIKNTELSKFVKTSPDSTYLVFCFSYTCPHCLNSIQNLRHFIKTKTVDSVVVFATGEESAKHAFNENFQPDFKITDLSMEAMMKLTDKFPTAYYVRHDTIVAAIESTLPAAIIFKKQYTNANK